MTAAGRAEAGAVIFDLDGVLADSNAHHRAAWSALLEEEGHPAKDEFWRQTIGRPAEEAARLLFGAALEANDAVRLAERKRAHYARLRQRGLQAVAGVHDFIGMLVRVGVPRAVATSASRHDADAVLAALRLETSFAVVVTADDVRWGKPNPEIYHRAATGLGVSPGTCLVFEDSLVGVHAARNAGMRVIGVTTAHTGRELLEAGAERAIADFVGFSWPV